MLQQLAKDVQEYIMSSKDWTKCMQYVAGQRKPGQLYSTQAIEAEVLLSEAFNRLELPNRIDEAAWEGFKGHAIYVAEGMEKEKIRPTTGSERGTIKLPRYANKSGTELDNASSGR